MDRYWLLTWTTYATWLPGDDRGFVSNVDRGDGHGERRNKPGTEPASAMRGMEVFAINNLTGPPVILSLPQAELLLAQFQVTARIRGWELCAVAIMRTHVHIVLGVPGDPEPDTLLRDLKSYGSRKLNEEFGKPASDTWWTVSGSRRVLRTDEAIIAAVIYVRDQKNPLLVWLSPKWEAEVGPRKR